MATLTRTQQFRVDSERGKREASEVFAKVTGTHEEVQVTYSYEYVAGSKPENVTAVIVHKGQYSSATYSGSFSVSDFDFAIVGIYQAVKEKCVEICNTEIAL